MRKKFRHSRSNRVALNLFKESGSRSSTHRDELKQSALYEVGMSNLPKEAVEELSSTINEMKHSRLAAFVNSGQLTRLIKSYKMKFSLVV